MSEFYFDVHLKVGLVGWPEIFDFFYIANSFRSNLSRNQIGNTLILYNYCDAPPWSIIKNWQNVKDYWWFWKKKNQKKYPTIPWNRIRDTPAQKEMKWKFSRGSLQRMTSRSARQCKFHISTIKTPLVVVTSPLLFALLLNNFNIKTYRSANYN